jgi:putative transposase
VAALRSRRAPRRRPRLSSCVFAMCYGPEFISKELDLWAFMHEVTLDFSRPGKPTDNAFIESFNGKFRGECPNTNWFLSLDEATRKCEAWRREYNEVRPHGAIGNQVPAALHRTIGNSGQPAAR